MKDIYQNCPLFENEQYLLRLISYEDLADLLKVYSDPKSVPLFNSDNCNGDDFHYTTMERMRQAIDFWLWEYGNRMYVRMSIIDKGTRCAVGTTELFVRTATDYFTDCLLLRLDLRSDFERSMAIEEILGLIFEQALPYFPCKMIATKAIPVATQRIEALKRLGFVPTEEKVIGHGGIEYGDYFVKAN
ncbi:MAG: GNAT family N-acetyltransferase [Clostridia bacterium]|nr:GNAT family N-acetyltransferase [Clostridia bacterium]